MKTRTFAWDRAAVSLLVVSPCDCTVPLQHQERGAHHVSQPRKLKVQNALATECDIFHTTISWTLVIWPFLSQGPSTHQYIYLTPCLKNKILDTLTPNLAFSSSYLQKISFKWYFSPASSLLSPLLSPFSSTAPRRMPHGPPHLYPCWTL